MEDDDAQEMIMWTNYVTCFWEIYYDNMKLPTISSTVKDTASDIEQITEQICAEYIAQKQRDEMK